jgi:hypothetical protein
MAIDTTFVIPTWQQCQQLYSPDLSSVEYTSFDKVLNTISGIGQGAVLACMDINSAFRLLILSPEDFELFGFKFKGLYFYDKCLPMGCSASCAVFEKFSSFLDWAIKERSGFESIEHYLDDFLFAGRADSSECTNLMSNFSSLCQELGIPLAVENTIGPSCVITFLGLEIDTLERVIKILPPKLSEVQQKLIETLNKKKITLKDLQSYWFAECLRTHARTRNTSC